MPVALVNTMEGSVPGDDDIDRLTTPDQLDRFYCLWQWTGSRAEGGPGPVRRSCARSARCDRGCASCGSLDEERRRRRGQRPAPRRPRPPPAGQARRAGTYHLHATSREAPLATRMAVEAAMALVDVIRAGELDRLRSLRRPWTATTCSSTCRRTGPAGSATPAAATGPTSPPTGPARRCCRAPRRYDVTGSGAELVAGRGLTHRDSWVTEQGPPARPIRQLWEAPVFTERTSVGLDVHARSVAAAAIDGVTGELFQTQADPVL